MDSGDDLGGGATPVDLSPRGVSGCNGNVGSGGSMDTSITLWQFLLELLISKQYSHLIAWTNRDGEFKLLNAEEVAHLWGLRKNKNNMNYDKLSRALRYYYEKNIIKKVLGQKFVYRFVSFPEVVKTENKIPFHTKMESIHKNLYPTAGDSPPPAPQQSAMAIGEKQRPKPLPLPRHPTPPSPSSKRHLSPDEDSTSSSEASPRDDAPIKRIKVESSDSSSSSSTTITSSNGRIKHKPAPISPIPTTPRAGYASLQTPLVAFTSPFLHQSKTPPVPVALWSPLLPSPRYSSGGSGTHFQFPPHPISPFFAAPYSPFEPQSIFSPTKSIPVLQ